MMRNNFSLRFYLKKPKNYVSGSMPIYMRITVDSIPKELASGKQCDPERWNAKAGRVNGSKQEDRSINTYLFNLEKRLDQAHTDLANADHEITAESDKIALKLGRSKRLLFTQMVDYFFRSKKDPADINDEFLKNTLLKSHKDYIGFIRTQEAELLIPIKTDLSRVLDGLGRVIQSFNGQVLKHNEQLINHQKLLLGNQEIQVKKFIQTDELMRRVLANLHTREQLKEKFLDIFEDYVKVRNSFNITTSAKEKEVIIQKVRTQIRNL